MANRYLVASGTWDATTTAIWASTSGGAPGASVPTAADDVVMDAASGAVTATVSANQVCRSLTCAGFTGTLAFNNAAISIGDGSGGALTFGSGMTLSVSGVNAGINMVSTSTNGGVGWSVTSNGKAINVPLTFIGAGKWVLADALSSSTVLVLTQGTLDTNSQSVTALSFNSNNANARTLTLGSTSMALTGGGVAWSSATVTNFTITANTANVTFSGASVTFSSGTFNGNGMSFNFTGSGLPNMGGSPLTINNLTRTGTAVKTDGITFSNITITGTLTLNSNSSVNRLLVQSTGVGTTKIITAANVVISGVVDFMDITGAGAATWTPAATGATYIGDAGGNSGITFTPSATQTRTGAGGNWSDAVWTSRVPLPQDDVIVGSGATGAISNDMPRIGRSIDFTGFAGTIAFGNSISPMVFGSFTLSSTLTITTNGPTFAGRGNFTITSAGKSLGTTVIQAPGGTYSLVDAYSTGSLTVNDGTFTTNNNSVTCAGSFTAASARAITLNLGTSTISVANTAASVVINLNAATTTLNAASATFVISTASANQRQVSLSNGMIIGTLTYTVASSPGALLLTGGSAGTHTYNNFNLGSGRTLVINNALAKVVFTNHPNINGTSFGYQYLAGVTGNYVSVPDSAALSITGDIDIRAKVAPNSWLGSTAETFVAKHNTSLAYSFAKVFNTVNGQLEFLWSTDGTTVLTARSTVATGFTDGSTWWVRVTLRVNNGSVQNEVKFWTSPDGSTWTQLGATITTAGTTSIADTADVLEIGARVGGTQRNFNGKFFRAQIRNNVLDNGTGIVLDADFTQKLVGANTFTESSVNAATVTISAAAQCCDGRVQIVSSTPGSAATFSYAGPQQFNMDYGTVQDITFTGGAAAYIVYGQTGVSVSGNTGLTVGQLRVISDAGGTWDATTTTTWMSGVVPTAADRVLARATSGSVTTTATGGLALCRSLDLTGYTGTLTVPAVGSGNGITIGDASGGSFKLAAGMTLVATSTIALIATSTNGGVGWGFTSAGKTLALLNFANAGGKWVLQDALTVTAGNATATLSSGTLDTNSQSVTAGTFNSSNSNVRSLILGASSITVTGTGNAWNIATATNFTLSAASSTITLSGANVAMQASPTAAGTYGTVVFTGSGIPALSGAAATFVNLTRTGTAVKTDALQFVFNAVVTGTLTFGGNTTQGVNRLLVQSNVPGTQRTITATGANVVISGDVDFMDMAISGFASWTNAGTAFVGDALGNGANIVANRTAPAAQTHTASAGGNWSDPTKWTSRVPLPQDNVVVDINTTGTLAADMPRLGTDITLTGFAGTFSNSVGFSLYGSLTMAAAMTATFSSFVVFAGRGTHTITSAGKTIATGPTFQGPGGSYTLQDAFTTTQQLNVTDGTFTTNNQSVTCATFTAQSGRTTVLNFGTSTVSLTTTAAVNCFSIQTTFTTFNNPSSTIALSTASTGTRNFVVQNTKTFGTITYTVANSPGALRISSSAGSTIGTLNVGSGRTLILDNPGPWNITSWQVNGAPNGYLYLPGVASNYVSVPDSVALSITGDLTLLQRVAFDVWVPASSNELMSKFSDIAAGRYSYRLFIDSGGKLQLQLSANGTTSTNVASSVSPTVTNGQTLWVLASWRASDGRVQFFTANGALTNPAASDFTQLGSNLTAAVGSLYDSTNPLEIGSANVGVTPSTGKIYRAMIYNGVFSTASFGGTLVLDANFTTKTLGANTFAEASANAATVTINGTLAQTGDGRVSVISSTAASAATLSSTLRQEMSYASIQDITAVGPWLANHSVNVSGNTNIVFKDYVARSFGSGLSGSVASVGEICFATLI